MEQREGLRTTNKTTNKVVVHSIDHHTWLTSAADGMAASKVDAGKTPLSGTNAA